MKKSIVSLLVLCVSLCAFAQTKQHMKFMGIPMGMSITNFQNKLAAKGVKYDSNSKLLSSGTRLFSGVFAGYDAKIFVYYDTSSKKVYRAKVVIDRDEFYQINQLFDSFYDMFEEKYGYSAMGSKYIDDAGYNTCIVYADLGKIVLFIRQMDADYYNHFNSYYVLHIDYFDEAAQNENNSNRLDDL